MSDPAADGLRIVIRLPHCRCLVSVDAVTQVAETAERLGFWGVSVEDHVLADRRECAHPGPDEGSNFLESLQVLAFVAARTRRIKLLTGVLQLPYRHPILLAKETMTLDNLSGGRLVLGVGVGALRGRKEAEGVDLRSYESIARREYDAFGITGNRGRLTNEYLEALTAIWTDEDAGYHGEHVNFDGLDMFPRTVQHPRPPIWVGGRSEEAHRRVAFLADGWYPSQVSPEMLREGRDRILELAAQSGRTISDFGPQNEFYIRRDHAEARATMRRYYNRFTSEEALFGQTFAGSPERVAEQFMAHREAGATFVDLRPVGVSLDDLLEQLHLIAEEVAPGIGADLAPAA